MSKLIPIFDGISWTGPAAAAVGGSYWGAHYFGPRYFGKRYWG